MYIVCIYEKSIMKPFKNFKFKEKGRLGRGHKKE
jgi:hypothetical protein